MRIPAAILPLVASVAVASAVAQEPAAAKPPAASSASWEWILAPYIWGSGISLDVQVNDNPVFGADASFSDIVNNLEIAGMLHFEARHDDLGLFLDSLYLSVSHDSATTGHPTIPDGTELDANLKMGLYELGGLYRPGGGSNGFDLLFGVRVIDAVPSVDATLPGPGGATTSIDASKTYLDGLVGVRYRVPIGKRWDFTVRGDIAAGGTDFTWNAVATFGVKFDDLGKYSLRAGYRYMEIELGKVTDRGSDVESTVTLSGPILGFVFRF